MSEVRVIEATALADELQSTDVMLIQVTSPEVYAQAHIPGALLVTPAELVDGTPPATGRLPSRSRIVALCDRIGYTPERNIVVYDDEGGGWAGRFGWTLDVIGHRSWRYLNGGLQAWAAAGQPLSSNAEKAPLRTDNADIELDTGPIAEIPDVLAAIESGAEVILDVRSEEEFLGQRQAAARVGHIPTAINFDWLRMKDAHDHQRLVPDLREQLAAAGLDGTRPFITHCQTHHRSGLSYMVGRVLGYDVRAYHGSWSEWGNRDDTPIDNPSA